MARVWEVNGDAIGRQERKPIDDTDMAFGN
jgi:hypothetical protein